MQLPKLQLSELPDLDQVTGVFGSLSDLASVGTDDRIVIIMVFIYETFPPESLIGM